MGEPRTSREALIAEVLGDLDALLSRVEKLPLAVQESEYRVGATIAALGEAGDRYRLAITAFTEQSRDELTRFLERKAAEVSANSVEEQRAALQAAAFAAFRSEAAVRAGSLAVQLESAAKEFRRSRNSRLVEHGFTALLAALATAALVLLVTGR